MARPCYGARISASLKPLAVEEFLAWERTQPVRYEFDGTQPVAMTGGTIAADRGARRLLIGLEPRLRPPCEVFGENVSVCALPDSLLALCFIIDEGDDGQVADFKAARTF